MPCGKHQLELDIPIEYTWNFVSDMNNWAPLVPGYVKHEIISCNQSTWEFKGEVGKIKKSVCLQIDITEWKKPSTVSFNLTGLNENFDGNGYFQAEKINDKLTAMTGFLNITARGFTGPMINSVLRTIVPKTTRELTAAVATKMGEVETVMH
ncbi:CoxG family protein [Virgibacillus byunsanensis]|uniref:CoxG family protein n=1 Tax=Virgibacillus byunsanensis TaxID=570945 RepID=A0ABW3LHH4_9BACI